MATHTNPDRSKSPASAYGLASLPSRDRLAAGAASPGWTGKKWQALIPAILAIMALGWLAACGPVKPSRPVRIAFMSDRDGQLEIYLMERDGSNPVNLTNNEAVDGLPRWSPQTDTFVFLTTRDEEGLSIYRMDADGANQTALVTEPPANASPPMWSPTGDWIAFGTGEVDPLSGATSYADIYLLNPAGENLLNITDSPSIDRFGTWSPDGSKILFMSDREGEVAIYAVDALGGDAVRLTDPEFSSATPTWSPDGTRIAYISNQDGDIEIYVMDANGENATRLTESEGFDAYPTWSPSGDKIAFLTDRDGNPEIYVMDLDGGNQTNLTNNPAQESVQGDFSWSPDGSQILFHSDRDGDVEIYVMDADGGNPTNLTDNAADDLASIWVP